MCNALNTGFSAFELMISPKKLVQQLTSIVSLLGTRTQLI
jgi:hypothetical protein